MSQETYNVVLTVFAFIAIFGNVIAFLWARIELHGQRKDTRELTELTSKLQQHVNRLSIELDQSIVRLNRVRDLINNVCLTLHSASVKLEYKIMKPDDLVSVRTTVRGSFVELIALGNVIGDQELIQNIQDFHTHAKKDFVDDQLHELTQVLDDIAIHLHTRVYQLLVEAAK